MLDVGASMTTENVEQECTVQKHCFHLTDVQYSVCERRAALCTVLTGETAVVMQFQKRCFHLTDVQSLPGKPKVPPSGRLNLIF